MGKTKRKSDCQRDYGCFDAYVKDRADFYFGLEPDAKYFSWSWDYEYWHKSTRDGHGYTSAASQYRDLSKGYIRREARRQLKRAIRDDDCEDLILPDKHNAKKFIWVVY